MKEQKHAKSTQPAAPRLKSRGKRGPVDAPDFLVRLTGKARAKSLAKEVILRHRHD